MRHDRVLSAVPIDCSLTGDEIADIVETELYRNSFQCGAHFLHLIVSDALNLMKEEINKFESWATFFRTRTGAEVLKRHQKALNLPFKKIPKVKILKFKI